MSEIKTCTKCGAAKPHTEYHKQTNWGKPGGLTPKCKQCRAVEAKVYRAANREKAKLYKRMYRASNPTTRRHDAIITASLSV